MISARRALKGFSFGAQNDVTMAHDQSTREQYELETSSKLFEEDGSEKENTASQDIHAFSFAESNVFASTGCYQAEIKSKADVQEVFDETSMDLFDPSSGQFLK